MTDRDWKREFADHPRFEAEKAQEGPMKTYFFLALAGLIAFAIAGMIYLEITQQIS